jgi:hypothetical protein
MNDDPVRESMATEARSFWQAEYGPIFWIHLVVISFCWLSPLLMSWQFVAIGVGLYYLQMLFIGACVFTILQYGNHMDARKRSFVTHYLGKLGFDFKNESVSWFHDTFVPVSILCLALVLQLGFDMAPLLA